MRRRGDIGIALGFLLPNLLGFLVFTLAPVVFSLVVSFSNWTLQHTVPFQWTGLENFRELVRDREFWLYSANTMYLMLGMPFAIAGSLFLAILLHRPLRGMVVYRTLFYLPSITSGVALMILWKVLLNPDFGPVNAAIDWVLQHMRVNELLAALGAGPAEAPKWLVSTKNLLGLDADALRLTGSQWGLGARDAIIMMGVWTAIGGNNMLLYLAALSNTPPELRDAAAVDGAGRWAAFRYVVWPQLAPTTFFIVVMSFIGGLQGGFEQARVMTNGGPAGTTTTLSFYIYIKAFEQFQIGYASAVSWVLFALIFAVTALNWRLAKKELTD
jgi:multiple sugar transport system permease protein